jgi:eukaryotic-like serine/threonine-protein kinase
MMAGLALTAGPAHAQYPLSSSARDSAQASQSAPHHSARVTYLVRADIDGHSKLTLRRRTARWYQIEFAAPGRHNGKNKPTVINHAKWYPAWPHAGENRDCLCHSSTFRRVMPRVPEKAVISSFKKLSCRDSCSATFSNGALVIDFNDDPSNSDAWYKVKVTITFEEQGRGHAATVPRIKISRRAGTPTATVTISGSGFSAHQAVDLYFDRSDEDLASTNGNGAFSEVALQVPSSAVPGTHYITAVQRHSGRSAQAKFAVNTNWAEDGFSAAHTGVNPYENVLSRSNVTDLGLDWTYHVGSNAYPGIEPSPAVVNGVVYMGGIPSAISSMYALSAATGKEIWSYGVGGFNIGGTPDVENGIVYTNLGFDSLYALSAATGVYKGGLATGSTVVWSPSVINGVVYFGGTNGEVYAAIPATSRLVWEYATGGAVTSAPTVVDGVAYVGSGDGNVYALNAVDGNKLWSFSTGAAINYSNVAEATGVAYAANSAGDVYALNAASGAELWSFDAGNGIASSIAVANGVVYIDTSGPNGVVDALSAATGQLLWSFTTSGGFDSSSPTVANGVVYVGSTDDNVYALNSATGAELWRFPTGSSVESSPAVVNGRVYVGSDDGNIYVFGLPGSQPAEARPRPSSLRPNYSLREQ